MIEKILYCLLNRIDLITERDKWQKSGRIPLAITYNQFLANIQILPKPLEKLEYLTNKQKF